MINNDQFPADPRIACIGEAMIELSSVDLAERTGRVGVAGDTYNTAVYMTRELEQVGGSVSYVTALGSDGFSDAIIEEFRREGLETGLIARNPNRLAGIYAINLDEAGERTFSYWRSISAARTLFGEFGPDPERLLEFDAVFLSAITLAILPQEIRVRLIDTCGCLKKEGKPVIFDSNYRPQLWSSSEEAKQAMDLMWRGTTIALPSVDDEQLLYPDFSPRQIATRIARLGVREVVLKCGSRGPLLLVDDEYTETDFPEAPEVVDTTAAGDSFDAGYIAARFAGAGPEKAARAGHDLASMVVGVRGAIAPRQ